MFLNSLVHAGPGSCFDLLCPGKLWHQCAVVIHCEWVSRAFYVYLDVATMLWLRTATSMDTLLRHASKLASREMP